MDIQLRVEYNSTTTVEQAIEIMFHEVARMTGKTCSIDATITDRISPVAGMVEFVGSKPQLAALVLAYAEFDHVEAKFIAPQLFTNFN